MHECAVELLLLAAAIRHPEAHMAIPPGAGSGAFKYCFVSYPGFHFARKLRLLPRLLKRGLKHIWSLILLENKKPQKPSLLKGRPLRTL